MKRILILLAAAAVFFTVQTANAAEEPVFVVLEGERLAFDQPPVMIENIVFIPIRGMALEMGAAISWQSGTAFLQKDNISAGLSVGSAVMDVNGQSVSLPAAPVILQDRMLVPMRVVSEVLGCRVSWSGENRTVYISPPEDVHRNYRKEKEILKLVNEIRQVNGLPVFAWDDGLASAARAHSRDMAENNFFDHMSSAGKSPFDRMVSAGIMYRFAAENIAMGYLEPEQVVDGWMNSEEHRANILNGNLFKMGVGLYDSCWTQDFTN